MRRERATSVSMDPESTDSDDSVRTSGIMCQLPGIIPLPPALSQGALNSVSALQARVDDLSQVEAHNIKKYDLLKATRARQDYRIQHKRQCQDKKWRSIDR